MRGGPTSRRRRRIALFAAGLAAAAGLLLPAAPAQAEGGVTVWDTSGKRPAPCPAIDDSNLRKLRGGCLVDMDSSGFDIVVRSIVGDMVFATCEYWHDLRVDGSGRTYLESIDPGGPYPCNDLNACDHKDVLPWRGRIEAAADGRLTHVVDACFDTCMGQFAGELRLELKQVEGRWVQTADRALVGDTGYQLDGGDWTMLQRGLDIRPSGKSAGGDVAGAWRLTGEPVGWPLQLG